MATTSLTKLEHKNELMSRRMIQGRAIMQTHADDIIRKGAGGFGAFLLGYTKKNGSLARLWSPMGMPKTLMVSAVTTGIAMLIPKKGIGRYFRAGFNGVGESSFGIGMFQWGAGETIAGDSGTVDGHTGSSSSSSSGTSSGTSSGDDVEGRRRRERARAARSLEQKIQDELRAMRQDRGGSSANDSSADDDPEYYDSQVA